MPCVWMYSWIVIGYSVEDIGVITGDDESETVDLNNLPDRDQVAGFSTNHALGSSDAMLWEHRTGQASEDINLEGLFQQARFSKALGLNNHFPSAVVGFHSYTSLDQPTPVLWEKTGETPLPTLGGGLGKAAGVNDAKTIVGWSTDGSGAMLACRWSLDLEWQARSLGTLGGPTSEATRINQKGTVVGSAEVAPGVGHAFRWMPGGTLQDVHAGPGTSRALGVNAAEEIVGELDMGQNVSQAFRWSAGGGMESLPGLPGADSSFANGINDLGVVVGSSFINGPQAVIWHGNQVARLTDQILQNPGWVLRRAYAINNAGKITGYGKDPSGAYRGFLLTPVRVGIKVPFCWDTNAFGVPTPLPTVPFPQFQDRPIPPVPGPDPSAGLIQVDGGGIIVTPHGEIIHVRPPRPDQSPFIPGAGQFEVLLKLGLTGRMGAARSEAGRIPGDLVTKILDAVIGKSSLG